MKWEELSDTLCPVGQTASLLGDRWTILILREALLGARRFDQFEAAIGLSPRLLSERLKRLVAEGIFKRDGDTRPIYKLTAAGRDLQPLILTMAAWGNRWRSEGKPTFKLRHSGCGAGFTPVVACSECGEPVGLNVSAELSAQLSAERADRALAFRDRRRAQAASVPKMRSLETRS